MVIENLLTNLTEITNALPPNTINRFEGLATTLQAVGIVFIIYIVYLFLRVIIEFKKNGKLKFIEKKVKAIDQKLDILLKEKNKKNKKN